MPTLRSNGINLAYEIQGSGPPLLLISGVGYGGWIWRWAVPELAPHFEVITFDNRGTDGSDKPGGPYSTKLMAEDAVGLLTGLGLPSAHVLGHSLGGMIAQELALAWPVRVRKLVLSASVAGPNSVPISPEALTVMTNRAGDVRDLVRRGVEIATAPGFLQQRPDILEELLAYRLAGTVPSGAYSAQVMAGATHNAEERLANLLCPTLTLTGTEDRVVPPENAELLARRIPDARTERVPGAGHLLFVEKPREAAQAVIRFLREV